MKWKETINSFKHGGMNEQRKKDQSDSTQLLSHCSGICERDFCARTQNERRVRVQSDRNGSDLPSS